MSLIPVSGIYPRRGNGNPFTYSWQRNPKDSGAWWATFHIAAKNWAKLSKHTHMHTHTQRTRINTPPLRENMEII